VTPNAEKERGRAATRSRWGASRPASAARRWARNPTTPCGRLARRRVDSQHVGHHRQGLWRIALGTIDRSNIGGPIQIASMAGQQAREGFGQLALFTAFISVNLAVLNLLPVPILDGGHLLFSSSRRSWAGPCRSRSARWPSSSDSHFSCF